MLSRTATIVRAPVVQDVYGNELRDWEHANRTELRAWLGSESGIEVTGERISGVTTSLTLFLEPAAEVVPTDRVELEGEPFEVTGPAIPVWRGMPSALHHVEVSVKRVVG
jgi:hypothetical protein